MWLTYPTVSAPTVAKYLFCIPSYFYKIQNEYEELDVVIFMSQGRMK
jgi:hypothetical protein